MFGLGKKLLLSSEDKDKISNAIDEAEKTTDGEIVVRVVPDSKKFYGNVYRHAIAEFESLGIQQTDGATGVLLFISVLDRQVEIIADQAIHDIAPYSIWSAAVKAIETGFEQNKPAAGIVAAVEIVGEVLSKHFPFTKEKNELSNEVKTE